MTFYSYRDPNLGETLKTFAKSAEWLDGPNISDRDIIEAKLRVFSALDQPIAPAGRGVGYFKFRMSDEMRAEKRQRIFDVTKEDIVRVARKYLTVTEPVSTVVLGPAPTPDMNDKWAVEE